MHRIALIVPLLLAVAPSPAAAKPDPADGITLFDGSNLDRWTMGPERSWVIEDGLITLKREFDGKEHNADYLWTKETMPADLPATVLQCRSVP